MPRYNLTLPYFISLILLLVGGLMWVFLHYEPNILRMIGLLMAVFICGIINLTYFLTIFNLFIRLILPGMICLVLFILFNQGSTVEQTFFSFFGVLNLLIGIGWFISKKINSKV
jgi:hypothetical protein